jgi:hypothetical protein
MGADMLTGAEVELAPDGTSGNGTWVSAAPASISMLVRGVAAIGRSAVL